MVVINAGSAGCSSEPTGPTEYVSFKYTVTPPGTTTGNTPLVLPIAPGSTVCGRSQKQINVAATSGAASVNVLLNDTATTPYQMALSATTQTMGVAEVTLQIPLTIDAMGNTSNPVVFKTTDVGNVTNCTLSLSGPDLFAVFDADFTCATLSTSTGRKLSLTEGHIHTIPCTQ